MEIFPLIEVTCRQQLRRWLEGHHTSEHHCWVPCSRSKVPPKDCITYVEVVEEALCFGWIDSTCKKLPDGRLAQRISPRRKNSHWTLRNLQRCADLEKRGLMTDEGRRRAFPEMQLVKH